MRLNFSDLFEALGYSPRCPALSGEIVEIRGWLSPAHDGSGVLLVERQGECPHCSPVAAILLPGFEAAPATAGEVVVRGRLDYGFAVDAKGNASFLRLKHAEIRP